MGIEPGTSSSAMFLKDEIADAYNARRMSTWGPDSSTNESDPNVDENGTGGSEGSPKFILLNYVANRTQSNGHDERLPETSEVRLMENSRDADLVISVGIRVYRSWEKLLDQNQVAHELFIPFEPLMACVDDITPKEPASADEPVNEASVLTLMSVFNPAESDFHERMAAVLRQVAQKRAENGGTLLTWKVQVESSADAPDTDSSNSTWKQRSLSAHLRVELVQLKTRSQLQTEVMKNNLVLMPGVFAASGFSGLECILSAAPCLVPEDSDVGDLIRFQSPDRGESFLLPAETSNQEWVAKVLQVLHQPEETRKRAATLASELRDSALHQGSFKMLSAVLYGKNFILLCLNASFVIIKCAVS